MGIENYFNNPESRYQHAASLMTEMSSDLNVDNPHAERLRLAIAEYLSAGWDAKLWELEHPADQKVTVGERSWMEAQARELQRGIFTDEDRDAELERVHLWLDEQEQNKGSEADGS